jgi:hypothetical protein
MSNLFVWNIYEKSFTPYWASIAPKHQVHRHVIQRKPSKVSPLFQDTRTKSMVRVFRKFVLKNAPVYYFGIILFAFGWEYTFRNSFIWAYKKKNINVFILLTYRDHFKLHKRQKLIGN